jgi:hypothetical protein
MGKRNNADSRSNKKEEKDTEASKGTMTLSGKVARIPKPSQRKGSFFRLAGNKKTRTSPKEPSGTIKSSSGKPMSNSWAKVESMPSVVPTLNDWIVNENNQVSGIISNSIDRDGEVVTTSELSTRKAGLREGVTVYTISGSAYILGKRQRASPTIAKSKLQSDVVVIPILNEWAVTAVGGLSGVVANCPDPDVEDGEILTTSKLLNDVSTLAPGDTVETINGSKYILGSRRPSGVQVESPETPVLAGLWVMALLIFVALTD